MDARPPDLPPAEEPRDAYDVGAGRKALRVLLALVIPAVVAGGGIMMALLMMAFGAASGQGDHDLRDRMVVGVVLSIGAFALCGIPATFAVLAPPSRGKLWWRACWAIAALSVLGALVCFGFYFSAISQK